MPFLQLEVPCSTLDPQSPDPVSLEDACFAAGALSVTLTDAADTPILEPALNTTPLWPQVHLSALFAQEADCAVIIETLTAALGRAPAHHFIEIADRTWEREWLKDFKPMRFGRRLWIYPHEEPADLPDVTIVRLDPGLAFGTGTHPTTALCLDWLDSAELEGCTVIDYGCGSGILAIAAVKLGAAHAFAVDHDPQALLATRENAQRNAVSEQIETLSPADPLPRAHALLANILALPLIELAPRFEKALATDGRLTLSGILSEQAEEVAAAYTPWIEMEPAVQRGDWVRLHGRKR